MENRSRSNKSHQTFTRCLIGILLVGVSGSLSSAYAATRKQKTPEPKEKHNGSKAAKSVVESQPKSSLQFGAAAGIQNLYIPSLGLEGVIQIGGVMATAEYGFFRLSGDQFSASTSFIGAGIRWQPSQQNPLFFGLSLGSREIQVSTVANINYTDGNSGEKTETPVTWSRNISQLVLYPKSGWIWRRPQSALVLGFGAVIPISTKASIHGNPSSVNGISDETYGATGSEKLRDVTSKTNLILPAVEFKYVLFFN